ncbi:four helix bundle protein [Flavobacterium sp. DGU11]|uniref:Four helix bundle protein n=1 Tax=Flavobacterium arundinis TaxID=3139143 RepID=A0ABU9I0K3_9FLAO
MIDYKKYIVWQKSHDLVLEVYKATASFPKSELFNMVSQINRACLSIPTNIAEGCGRETQKELLRFLYISSGSAHELEYLFLVSKDLKFIDEDLYIKLYTEINEIKKMLAALIRKIAQTVNR